MSQVKAQRRYNWVPDKKDGRDLLYGVVAPPHPAALPALVDLEHLCSPVFDQGDIGSCTANALACLFEFAELEELRGHQVIGQTAPELYELKYDPVSRLFLYYQERKLEGTIDQDAGAQIRDGIKALATTGICRESIWAYQDANVFLNPTEAAYVEAGKHKIQQYSRLLSFLDMKHCLASGKPFAFGMAVPESLESQEVASTGYMPMPNEGTQFIGGHAVACVGYNDATKRAKIRNSWGSGWGKAGYFEVDYAFISSAMYCQDYWSLTK